MSQKITRLSKFMVLLLLALLPLCSVAQRKGFKMVESVPAEMPSWVGGGRTDCINVGDVEGATLEDAKAKARTFIIEDIAHSVAVFISGEIIDNTNVVIEDDNTKFTESFINHTVTKIANLPAIQGITLSKSKMYYKHFYNRKTDESYYVLYVQYPFSNRERQELISAYNKREMETDAEISRLEDEIGNLDNLEDIGKNINKLRSLKEQVADFEPRAEKLNNVIGLYEDLVSSIAVRVVRSGRGNLAVKLVYQERIITTSQKPMFKSNCANDFSYRYDDGLLFIGFDDEYCGYTDIPTLTVVFKVANLKIQKEIKLKQ